MKHEGGGNMLFQLLGITGAILLFYGLLAFALTQASTWFFWTLLGTGTAFLLSFIVMALNRTWQKIIGLFVVANALWIAAHYFLRDKSWWTSNKVLLVALLLNVVFFWIARSLLKDMFQSRSMRFGTSAAFYSIIVIFILIVVNIGAQDFYKEFDFTVEKVNTLSDQSTKIAKELKDPMSITAFFDGQNPAKDRTKKLLENYQKLNKNIRVQIADPDKDKILAEQKKAGDGDVLIEYKGQSHITKDVTEQGITQAFLKVARTNTPMVCFTSGHGEMSLEESEEGPRSLSILKASLANEGYDPKTLPLITDQIPQECSLVVIASPAQRFAPAEVAVFDVYLENGGKLVALLDPLLPNTKVESQKFAIQSSGFEDLLKKWGVSLGNNLILEKHLTLFQGVQADLSVRSMSYGNHPVVDVLKGKQTVFETVQSVRKAEGFAGTTYELIKSADKGNSWAETNIDLLFRSKQGVPDGADIEGPVTIAMASERETPKKTQLLVFGDGDFISNGLIQSYEFNYDLFLNSLNWMSGDVQNISIRPKKIRTSVLELTPKESNAIFYLSIITIPMLVLIFGINLWWYRKRKG